MKHSQKACLIVGAGAGLGASLGRAFAREGLTVCLTRRPRHLAALDRLAAEIEADGGSARAYGVDARNEEEMIALVDRIEAEVGPLEVVVFNIGANVFFPITETTARVYSKVWEMAGFAGFLTGREAARVMTPRARGTILFTGAQPPACVGVLVFPPLPAPSIRFARLPNRWRGNWGRKAFTSGISPSTARSTANLRETTFPILMNAFSAKRS